MYYTYIASNKWNRVLYTGVTNNLDRRIDEHHKKEDEESFTAKYKVSKILWYEVFPNPADAIAAEKKIKGWKRIKKLDLIRTRNPKFEDLRDAGRDPSTSSG